MLLEKILEEDTSYADERQNLQSPLTGYTDTRLLLPPNGHTPSIHVTNI